MTRKHVAAIALVGALALGAASVAWAVSAAGGGSLTGHHYGYGPGMMGYGYTATNASPVSSIGEARQHAQAFADKLGLKTGEILRFERNYYVVLVDRQGSDATEVLVDPATGATSLEYGPAMMWNTKYGMMTGRYAMDADTMRAMMGDYGGSYGGMMGGGMMRNGTGTGMMGGAVPGTRPASKTVTIAEARALAQKWLDANERGTTVESGGDTFPGYYTLETLRDGKIAGMISVNASTGAVFPHWWHGKFVERAE